MAKRIFINYRRDDAAGYAGRMYDRLVDRFGKDSIFMDVSAIEAGLDFANVLEDAVQSCDVAVVLIGPNWLKITDASGRRRLDDPDDYVRLEVSIALKRDIRVIPVLVGGAEMPRADELPDDLKSLPRRHALKVDHVSFDADVKNLINHLESALINIEDFPSGEGHVILEDVNWKKTENQINALLKDVDQEMSLGNWSEAKEKLEKVLKLDAGDHDARSKLETVEKAISEANHEAEIESEDEPETNEKLPKDNFLKSLQKWWFALPVALLLIVLSVVWNSGGGGPDPHETNSNLAENSSEIPIETSTKTPTEQINTITPTDDFVQTPESGDTIINPIDESPYQYISSGKFLMGSVEGYEDESDDEGKVQFIDIGSFWIGQTEVTNAMYRLCYEDNACEVPGGDFFRDQDYANHPVTYVSWEDAHKYCAWAGGRLPTEAEWEKAARGGLENELYPWESESPTCRTNADNGAQFSNCDPGTVVVGSFEPNNYGLFDMAGNVFEWTSSCYQKYPYDPEDGREDIDSSCKRVLRGGSWYDGAYILRVSYRVEANPENNSNILGFRCVLDVEP